MKLFSAKRVFTKFVSTKRVSWFCFSSFPLHGFFHQLSVLLESGLPLITCLRVQLERSDLGRNVDVIRALVVAVERGESFSQALSSHLAGVEPLIIQLITVGEQSGNIGHMCRMIATYLKQREIFKQRMQHLLFTPVLTFIFSLVILAAILLFVVPQFEVFFTLYDKPLPASTKTLLAVSQFVRSKNMYGIYGIVALSVVGLLFIKRQPAVKGFFDRFVMVCPVVRQIILMQECFYVTHVLLLFLRAGATLPESLAGATMVVRNQSIRNELLLVDTALQQGQSLKQAFSCMKVPLFSEQMLTMISIGEGSGQLVCMLQTIERMAHDHVKAWQKWGIRLVQPSFLLITGFLIAGVLVTLYLPIFSLMSMV